LGRDLKIIGMTVLKGLGREGLSAEGHATAKGFMGTEMSRKMAHKAQE